jgi:integrase
MIEDMQVRNLSPHTQAAYVQQVSLFARHFHQSPQTLGPEEIRAYQLYLTNERKLAPSSILQAVGALRFLYKVTLHKDWTVQDVIPAPKKPQTLPVVLSPEEVLQFLACVSGLKHRTLLMGCYAAQAAPLGGPPAQGHRHRQPTDGHPGRTGQGPEMLSTTFLALCVGEIYVAVVSQVAAIKAFSRY